MLQQGDANAKVQEFFPELVWSGLGDGTVFVQMPS